MDSHKIQSTALDAAGGEQNSTLHGAEHAHSRETVQQSYLLNPTSRFETGTVILYREKEVSFNALPLDPRREEEELQRMRDANDKIKHQLHESLQAKKRSGRKVNSRQVIRSELRNIILYSVLEIRDVSFSKAMFVEAPQNTKIYHYFNNWLLSYMLGQPEILEIAKPDLKKTSSLMVFCLRVKFSLRSFNRTAVTIREDGTVGTLFAIGNVDETQVIIIIKIILYY